MKGGRKEVGGREPEVRARAWIGSPVIDTWSKVKEAEG